MKQVQTVLKAKRVNIGLENYVLETVCAHRMDNYVTNFPTWSFLYLLASGVIMSSCLLI